MKKSAQIGLCVYAIAVSDLLMADCSRTMPEQLLEDCIVYESAGSSFPTSDYAHMNEYQDWLKTQRQKQTEQPPARIQSSPVAKSEIN